MKKSNYFSWLLISLCAFWSAVGCGAAPEEVKTAPPPAPPLDENLFSLVPAISDTVVRVDIEALRASTLFQTIRDIMKSDEVGLYEKKAMMDPLLNADEIVLTYNSDETSGADHFAVLLKGVPNPEQAFEMFGANQQAQSVQLGDFNGIRTPKLVLLELTERTLVFGSEKMINLIVDLASGQGEALKIEGMAAERGLADKSTARFVYKRRTVIPNYVIYWSDALSIDPKVIEEIDGHLTLNDEMAIEISVLVDEENNALVVASELEQARASLNGNMFVALLGLSWVLEKVAVTKQAKSVVIAAKFDSRDLQELQRLFDRFKRLEELMNADKQAPYEEPPKEEKSENGGKR